MFKKLETLFLSIIILAVLILAKNWYDDYMFYKNEIPSSYKEQIVNKEIEVLTLMKQNYGVSFKVPLIVTDEFKGKLYGLTSYRDGEIKIYLNKKVMRESMEYMIKSVIAHEYAHALAFKMGFYNSIEDGHNSNWKDICVNLGGDNCEEYVNTKEIIMSKMPF